MRVHGLGFSSVHALAAVLEEMPAEERPASTSSSSVHRYESGDREPPADYVAALVELADVNPMWVLLGVGTPEGPEGMVDDRLEIIEKALTLRPAEARRLLDIFHGRGVEDDGGGPDRIDLEGIPPGAAYPIGILRDLSAKLRREGDPDAITKAWARADEGALSLFETGDMPRHDLQYWCLYRRSAVDVGTYSPAPEIEERLRKALEGDDPEAMGAIA